ncbi:zf-HC2 domain-containing protein [Kineococcus sp. TBRC 1896]|uniref:Zf-HC2 domain-containing protein n=1 Tax=Kineococcus mangrovi TaxID=1660183 RepID=A0ABV4I7C2_9ACTN
MNQPPRHEHDDHAFDADPYATTAGPYVLGALTPSDRADFEHHLRSCADCRRSVEELAGLPGLLARTPREVVDTLTEDDPHAALREGTGVPDTVLPALLRAVRRHRLTRRAALAGGLVAAAGLAALALTGGLRPDAPAPTPQALPTAPSSAPPSTPQTPAAPPGPALSMDPLVPTPITATVALTEVGWGTKVDLVCAYADATTTQTRGYALYVTGTDGSTQQIGTWTAVPGGDAQLSGATSWTPAQIRSVEIKTLEGATVLRRQET